MDELTKIAIKYGTDKWGKHHYTPVYYEMFKDRRESVKKVLEIGPAEGAGLFMFREFFPNADIYGAEIDRKRVDKLQRLDRIHVYEIDQSLSNDLYDIVQYMEFFRFPSKDIAVVIDDGSHKPEDQLFSCLTLMPMLPKNTIYIIEDVADESITKYLAAYDIKVITLSKRYDDRLIIVKHKYE